MASSEQQMQEQLQQPPLSAGNDGGSGGKGESASATTGFPGLGQVRCYWTIMDAMMNFRYLDPVLQDHMQEVSLQSPGKPGHLGREACMNRHRMRIAYNAA